MDLARALRRGLLIAATLSMLVATPDTAHAADAPKLRIGLHGDYLLRATALSPLPVDGSGSELGQSTFVEHRLRLRPEVGFSTFSIIGELDLWDGLTAGDASIDFELARRPRDEVRVLPRGTPRYLYGVWSPRVGRIQAGLMGSRWGLGLLASDGTGRDDDELGDNLYGDRVIRVLAATRPFLLASRGKPTRGAPLGLALAFDVVFEDATARFGDGDRAYQGVLALLWSESDDGKPPKEPADAVRELGVYAVYRTMKDSRDEHLNVFVLDLYGTIRFDLGNEATLTLAAEGAFITGRGTIARSLTAPDGHRVLAGGAVGRATLARGFFDVVVEVGYASGDASPDDDRITSFKFNPDYNVGLLMFEEVLAWQSARSADRAADPETIGVPPGGVNLVPTNGSVTNAVYINARHRTRISKELEVHAGLLYAIAPYPVVDPFNTFRAGGVPRSYLGGEVGRSYGFEADLALQWNMIDGILPATWTLQGGFLLPGDVFDDASGYPMDPVWQIVLRLWLGW